MTARKEIVKRSADYYKQKESNFDVLVLTQRVYRDSIENLQSWIKSLWYE